MSDSNLKLVIVGQGSTRGRRGHYLRLRESLVYELDQASQGQMYLRIEWLIRLGLEHLRSRKDMIVIKSQDVEATRDDFELLEQRELRIAASDQAVKGRKPSSAKTSATKPTEPKKPTATKKAPAKKAATATKKTSIAKKSASS